MEMQLHFAQASTREPPQRIEVRGGILLPWEEKGVSRGVPVGVAKLASELGIALLPGPYARKAGSLSRAAPERLVVIAEGEKHMAGSFRAWRREVLDQVPAVAADPAVNVLVGKSESEQEDLLSVEEYGSEDGGRGELIDRATEV
jgi:hypothetical protein